VPSDKTDGTAAVTTGPSHTTRRVLIAEATRSAFVIWFLVLPVVVSRR
jgi:hypothetical protein